MLPNMQPLLQTTRTEVRSNSQHLLVLGGVLRQQLSVSNQLRAYHETKKEWLKLQEMEQLRYQHGVVPTLVTGLSRLEIGGKQTGQFSLRLFTVGMWRGSRCGRAGTG